MALFKHAFPGFLKKLVQMPEESELALSQKDKPTVEGSLVGGTKERDGRHPSELTGGR